MRIVPEFLPPAQKEGESAADYIERAEWARSRVPAEVLYAPIQGHVAGSDGIKHWTKADYLGRSGSNELTENEKVFAIPTIVPVTVFKTLPEIRKRSGRERMSEIRLMLQALALSSYSDGVMRLPRSICEKLVRLGVYGSLDEVRKASVEQVCQKFERYGQVLLERAKTNRDLTPAVSTESPTAEAVAV